MGPRKIQGADIFGDTDTVDATANDARDLIADPLIHMTPAEMEMEMEDGMNEGRRKFGPCVIYAVNGGGAEEREKAVHTERESKVR